MLKKIIKKVINLFGYNVSKSYSNQNAHKKGEIKKLFRNFLELYFSKIDPKDFFFVEIGANDGISGDPIYEFVSKYNLHGILVEPQKDVFERLKKNYGNSSNLKFANIAISDVDGKKKFYTVKESFKNASDQRHFFRVTGISSFDKEVFKKTLKNKLSPEDNLDDLINETLIDAKTPQTLMREYNIDKIDLLQIDVEGYDYEVLKMFDLDRFSPSLINYESKHLSDKDKVECELFLKSKNYKLFVHGSDTCAFK